MIELMCIPKAKSGIQSSNYINIIYYKKILTINNKVNKYKDK